MKKLSLLIATAIMIALAACSQQENTTVADSLTPEEQAKYDDYVTMAVEAGWTVVDENATVEQKRKLIETDLESFENFINYFNDGIDFRD